MDKNLTKNSLTKVHVGCGTKDFGPDWYNVDRSRYDHIDSMDDLLLNFKNNVLDLIYASHYLEYCDLSEAKQVLKSWYKKLKPGGIVRLAVPDFRVIAKLYCNGYPLDNFLGPLYGKWNDGISDYVYHKMVYDAVTLENLLRQTGFKTVRFWDWRKVDHGKFDDYSQAHLPHMDKENGTLISLNMEGVK